MQSTINAALTQSMKLIANPDNRMTETPIWERMQPNPTDTPFVFGMYGVIEYSVKHYYQDVQQAVKQHAAQVIRPITGAYTDAGAMDVIINFNDRHNHAEVITMLQKIHDTPYHDYYGPGDNPTEDTDGSRLL